MPTCTCAVVRAICVCMNERVRRWCVRMCMSMLTHTRVGPCHAPLRSFPMVANGVEGGKKARTYIFPAPGGWGTRRGMNGVNASPRRDGPSGLTGSGAFGNVATFSGRTLTHRDDHIVGKSITMAKGPYRCSPLCLST